MLRDVLTALSFVANCVAFFVIVQMARPEPSTGKQECVPLYNETGWECC